MPKHINGHPFPSPLRNLAWIKFPFKTPGESGNKLAQRSADEADPDQTESDFAQGSLCPAIEAGTSTVAGVRGGRAVICDDPENICKRDRQHEDSEQE
jgi:hypothetical protein